MSTLAIIVCFYVNFNDGFELSIYFWLIGLCALNLATVIVFVNLFSTRICRIYGTLNIS